jgi:hypothetical protein
MTQNHYHMASERDVMDVAETADKLQISLIVTNLTFSMSTSYKGQIGLLFIAGMPDQGGMVITADVCLFLLLKQSKVSHHFQYQPYCYFS